MGVQSPPEGRIVIVDGKRAMYLFTQFAVDRDPVDLFDCLNPLSWVVDDPAVFKTVEQTAGDSTDWPPTGDPPWRRTYREDVLLVGDPVENELVFDFYRDPDDTFVASTFDLPPDPIGRVEIDRGFCLATRHPGGGSWIKALKIVRLGSEPRDQLATALTEQYSQAWGNMVEAIVEAVADGRGSIDAMPLGRTSAISGSVDPSLFIRVLASTYSHTAADYAKTAVNLISSTALSAWSNILTRSYGLPNLAQDSLEVGWRAFAESARFTQNVLNFLGNFDPGSGALPSLAALVPVMQTEETFWRVATPPAGQKLRPGDLTRLSPERNVIRAEKIVLSPGTVEDQPAIHVVVNTMNVPAGLYAGNIYMDSQSIPIQFYVSQATLIPTASPSTP
jgi:hypothetical protein